MIKATTDRENYILFTLIFRELLSRNLRKAYRTELEKLFNFYAMVCGDNEAVIEYKESYAIWKRDNRGYIEEA